MKNRDKIVMGQLDFIVICVLCYQFVTVHGSSSSTSVTTIKTTTKRYPDDSEDNSTKFGDPYWLIVGIILFVVILAVSLTVSLTFGLYKRISYQRKHGLYKQKSKVYQQAEDSGQSLNLDVFIVQHERNEPSSTSSSPCGSTTAVYVGSS